MLMSINKILIQRNPITVSNETPQWLHGMKWCDDNEIGEIDKSYNYLVGYYNDRNIVNAYHYTDGGPWYKGYENVMFAEKWLQYLINNKSILVTLDVSHSLISPY